MLHLNTTNSMHFSTCKRGWEWLRSRCYDDET